MYLWEIFYWSWSLTKIGSLQSTTWTSPWTVLCVSITLLHHSPCAVCTNFSPSLDILSRDLPLSQITFSHWTLSINSLSHITSADNILLTQANFLQKMWFEAENHATHLGQWRNVQLQISLWTTCSLFILAFSCFPQKLAILLFPTNFIPYVSEIWPLVLEKTLLPSTNYTLPTCAVSMHNFFSILIFLRGLWKNQVNEISI